MPYPELGLDMTELIPRDWGDSDEVSRLPVDCVECEVLDSVDRVFVDACVAGLECVTAEEMEPPRAGWRNWNGYCDIRGCPRLDIEPDVRG